MRIEVLKSLLAIVALLLAPASVTAATPVFTEDFATAANWATGGFTALTEVAAGSVDGGSYVSLDASFDSIGQGTIYRGHSGLGASGGAFAGDWITEGYIELSAFVRHNAPVPLGYFARLASPNNFPAAGVVSFAPVLPNTWTEITFNVTPSSPQIVTYEGSDHNTVFSNIGNIQLAVDVPVGFEMDSRLFTFDLDKVSLSIPEPATVFLLLGSLAFVAVSRPNR